MHDFQVELKKYLHCCDNSQTHYEKGASFEDLTCYAFESIPGIINVERDKKNVFGTEEIDLVFYNELLVYGLPSPAFPPYIFVECKNWSNKVSSIEISWFDTKLRSRGLDFGILVAANGITGEPYLLTEGHSIIAKALSERRKIIVITRDEIEALTDERSFIRLLKMKQGKLLLTMTSLL